MRAERTKTLMIVGGVATLILLAISISLLLFDINSYKLKIETAASETTGLDVKIAGKMRLSFFPFGLSAKDIHFSNKGIEILSMEHLKLRAELIPLLKKQLIVTACELVKPAATIVKDVEGKYNFEGTEGRPSRETPGRAFTLKELKVSMGTLVYLDKTTGERTELKEVNMAIKDFAIADTSGDIMRNVSFSGAMECKELRKKELRIDSIKSGIRAEQGLFSFKPLTLDIFGAKGEGEITASKSEGDAEYGINLNVSKLDFDKLQESFAVERLIGGKGDLVASLMVREKAGRSLIKSAVGTLSLRGDNLSTYAVDLDKVLSSYETSQKFNLVDVGAFFIAGPLGTAALKGYRYGDVYYQTQGGQGTITRFISHWKIKEGVAEATDCALATQHNRVALTGKLNLVSERYDNVVLALLDEKGCATFKQTISGPFGSPRVGAVSAVGSIGGPISDLYRKAKGLIQGGKCEVFYNGAVQQPR